jgi:hypothetical protein
MSVASVMKFLGILDETDMYMRAKGGGKGIRVVGRGMLKVDRNEIYSSESYKQACEMAKRIAAEQA